MPLIVPVSASVSPIDFYDEMRRNATETVDLVKQIKFELDDPIIVSNLSYEQRQFLCLALDTPTGHQRLLTEDQRNYIQGALDSALLLLRLNQNGGVARRVFRALEAIR